MLKELIEYDKFVVEDYEIINELASFVAKKQSYEAEARHHDDLKYPCYVAVGHTRIL